VAEQALIGPAIEPLLIYQLLFIVIDDGRRGTVEVLLPEALSVIVQQAELLTVLWSPCCMLCLKISRKKIA
jgi:hypothetical protein